MPVTRKQRVFNPAHMPDWWFIASAVLVAVAIGGLAALVGGLS